MKTSLVAGGGRESPIFTIATDIKTVTAAILATAATIVAAFSTAAFS
jgi:hypothetical protein